MQQLTATLQGKMDTLQNQKDEYFNYRTIVSNNIKNYSNKNYSRVNQLLDKYKGFFDPSYRPFFAKRFNCISEAAVHNAAELAATASNPQRYFAAVINREYKKCS